jgi:GNAT superfamily N-acetyltransferase
MKTLDLPNGYYDLPKGKLVNVATFLAMTELPQRALKPLPANYHLAPIDPANLAQYRNWFRAVGEDIMWFSRVLMPDAELHAQLANPQVHSFALMQADVFCGLLELDFKQESECELSFFGLMPDRVGAGLGRSLMDEALRLAFARPISRLFVHTCTFDHPRALDFYVRSGFVPYARKVEIHDDPRLTGELPRTAASQIPIIL